MERYRSQDETEDHPRRGEDHDAPPTDDIDILQRKQRENEIGSRNNQPDSNGLIETNRSEQGSGIVHQGVEAAKLLEGLQTTSHS